MYACKPPSEILQIQKQNIVRQIHLMLRFRLVRRAENSVDIFLHVFCILQTHIHTFQAQDIRLAS